MNQDMLAQAAWYATVACFVYLGAVTVLFAGTTIVSIREHRMRARESRFDDLDTLRESPYTIPVSIIVPAFNEEACVGAVVTSLLALDYPEYEVIVVNDGSTDGMLAHLRDRFDLVPTGTFFRKLLPSAPIDQIYTSRRDPRLTVVSKKNGGKADALNCGANLARYRYVCCVDADTVYRPDALLKGMRLVVEDPEHVLGVTSRVEVSRHPEKQLAGQGVDGTDLSMLLAFQSFDYMRAYLTVRSAWSRSNYMLCASGAFMIWRRDVILDLGGFARDFTCEDIEFTFRVHHRYRTNKRPYRILALPDAVGVTEGPAGVRALIRQRARWQRVILETVWHYRRMLFSRRFGTVGMLGMPFYVMSEVIAPVFQCLAIASVPLAMLAGILNPYDLLRMLLLVALGLGSFTAIAVMLHQDVRSLRIRDLTYLLLLSPFDLILYRPIVVYASLKGTIDFLRGSRSWDKFDRNKR